MLARSGAEWIPSFIELVQLKLTRITDPAVQAMVATGLIGALSALFTAYLDGRLAATREQFIDHCVELLLSGCERLTPAHLACELGELLLACVGELSFSLGPWRLLRSALALAARPSGLPARRHQEIGRPWQYAPSQLR